MVSTFVLKFCNFLAAEPKKVWLPKNLKSVFKFG